MTNPEELRELLAKVDQAKAAYEAELENGISHLSDRARLAWVNALADMRYEAGVALPDLLAKIEADKGRIEGLEKGLEPFAKCAAAYESFDGQHDFEDDWVIENVLIGSITVGDLRTARTLLQETPND